jgi:hypothetical protein
LMMVERCAETSAHFSQAAIYGFRETATLWLNYTDRATATCRRSSCQFMRIEGVACVTVTDPFGRILGILDRSRYFFFQVAPQLYSRGWVDPSSDSLLLRKSGSSWNLTRASGSVARNSDHLTVNASIISCAVPSRRC